MNQQLRDQVHPFLQSGEALIVVCACEPAPGVPTPPVEMWTRPAREETALEQRIKHRLPGPLRKFLEPKPMPQDRQSAADSVVDAFTSDSVVVNNATHRAGFGKNLEGGWQSQAGQFVIGHYNARGEGTTAIAVTDRRVLVLGNAAKVWQLKEELYLRWEASRSAVPEFRRNAKGVLQRGRFEAVFADGSWVALLTEVPTHAEQFTARASAVR
ncbi:hypothetical protein [Streptomyces sp. NPDC048639]|uniref:hypothetical protein n=1 Tax=Streptomyces sp. NPDC048639 TaxID=3365581 RepID=UPI00371E4695